MKTLIATAVLALGLVAGQANAAQPLFDQIRDSAPRSDIFADIQASAPKSIFDQLNETAPRTIFDDIRDSAPRSDGVFGDLERNAP